MPCEHQDGFSENSGDGCKFSILFAGACWLIYRFPYIAIKNTTLNFADGKMIQFISVKRATPKFDSPSGMAEIAVKKHVFLQAMSVE